MPRGSTKVSRRERPPRELHSWEPPATNEQLDDAYKALKMALLPRNPLKELTEEDISNANEPLLVWEQSEEISGKYTTDPSKNLVREMLSVLEYVGVHPGVANLDIVPLQERCNALQKKIYKVLLKELHAGNSSSDHRGLVTEWLTELERHVLGQGSHDLTWYRDNFRKTLGLIEASHEVSENPSVVETLLKLLNANYIPHFDHLEIVHAMLTNSDSLSAAAASSFAIRASAAVDPKKSPEFSRTQILENIEAIKLACRNRDLELTQKTLNFFETMPETTELITCAAIQVALFETATHLSRLNLPDREELLRGLHATATKFKDATKSSNPALRPSFYSAASTDASNVRVTFRDSSSIENAPYSTHTDRGRWVELTLEASPREPIQSLLLRFVDEANAKHRHPFFPISDFDLCVIPDSASSENSGIPMRVGKNWFTQGSVEDILHGSPVISYNRHDGLQDLKDADPPFRLLPVFQRQYPATAPRPPTDWVKTPSAEGPWQELSSLQFMGDGVDLTAHSTYPPLIAQTLLLPIDFSVIAKGSIFLRRRRVPPTLLQAKLEFPLSSDQARSLLGRTVLYQAADPEETQRSQPRLPQSKRRKTELELDPVYLAFVWGLDPEAKIIKTFEFSDQGIGELCRTFQFGDSQTSVALSPQNLPNDYPALRKVAKFDWIGLVELPVASPPSEDAVAAKEELLRKRKRFSNILAAAPSLFEIGIGGDCAIVVGELTLHPPGSPGSVTIENCKRGIWESGYRDASEGADDFLIWVRWLRQGHIDLTAPASSFSQTRNDEDGPLSPNLSWEPEGRSISVDGGMAGIIARGILGQEPMVQLTGRSDDGMREAFLQMLILSGSEDGRYHIPGGISSYTGGDGTFSVHVVEDSEGEVVGVRVIGNGGVEDNED